MILQPRSLQAAARATRCSARSTTLMSSIARVMGPMPPGIGATCARDPAYARIKITNQPGIGAGGADIPRGQPAPVLRLISR